MQTVSVAQNLLGADFQFAHTVPCNVASTTQRVRGRSTGTAGDFRSSGVFVLAPAVKMFHLPTAISLSVCDRCYHTLSWAVASLFLSISLGVLILDQVPPASLVRHRIAPRPRAAARHAATGWDYPAGQRGECERRGKTAVGVRSCKLTVLSANVSLFLRRLGSRSLTTG